MFRPLFVVTIALLLSLSAVSSALAQDSSLSGRVVDSSGGVVPGAAVVLTSQATGVTAEAITNAEGLFTFPATRPGLYAVKVTLAGFATAVVGGVRVEIGEQRARYAIFDLHAARGRVGRVSSDQKSWRLDRALPGHSGVDDVQDDVVHGSGDPRVAGGGNREAR